MPISITATQDLHMHRCRNCNTVIDTAFLTHCPTCGTPVEDGGVERSSIADPGGRSPWKTRLVMPLVAIVLVGTGVWYGWGDLQSDRPIGPFETPTELAVTSLRVGDCLDLPPEEIEVFGEVTVLPCDRPHQLEKYLDVTHPARDDLAWPGYDDVADWTIRACYAGFESYVGRSFEEALDLDFYFVVPAPSAWDEGERTGQCFVMRADEGHITGSLRAAGSATG